MKDITPIQFESLEDSLTKIELMAFSEGLSYYYSFSHTITETNIFSNHLKKIMDEGVSREKTKTRMLQYAKLTYGGMK